MNNIEVRRKAFDNSIKMGEIASALCKSRSWLSQKMKTEMDDKTKADVLEAIDYVMRCRSGQ